MDGICECGCGGKTNKYPQSITKTGVKNGEYARFMRFHSTRKPPNKWSKLYDKCVECGTTDRPHQSHGLCVNCKNRQYDMSPKGRESYRKKMSDPEKIKKMRERCHRYYLEHKEQAKESAKRWVKNHPDRRKAVSLNCVHRRRDKYKEGTVTLEFLTKLKQQNSKCPLCGVAMEEDGRKPNGYNLDHIIPLSIGGKHEELNLRYICRTCNLTRDDGRLRLHLFTKKATV